MPSGDKILTAVLYCAVTFGFAAAVAVAIWMSLAIGLEIGAGAFVLLVASRALEALLSIDASTARMARLAEQAAAGAEDLNVTYPPQRRRA